MSGLEPLIIPVAGVVGKLAWKGIKGCWDKYQKKKSKDSGNNDANNIVASALKEKGDKIGKVYDQLATEIGPKFVEGDCEYCPC
jgi:hypothetical protein